MARLSKARLLDRVTEALQDGEWNYLFLSTSHPFELLVYRDTLSFRTRIYIWNVTHGGGEARAANEYRIQITGVHRFDITGVDRTVVLGWWDEVQAFAGFDVSKHLGTLGASPSLQILEETFRQALIDRLSTQRKTNDEIAVALVPALLGDYISQLPALHGIAESASDLMLLGAVIANPRAAEPLILAQASEPRRMVLTQVARKLRDASFKDRVLTAYKERCAMCGIQLKLIDAAHILPVAHGNTDDTNNGLALCATHHRAFDRALVTVAENYGIALNGDRLTELKKVNLDHGLPGFRRSLRPVILLPADPRDRPHPDLIRQANSLRRWRSFVAVA